MIVCIGEILADMIGFKQGENSVSYSRFAGGAPFNVACNIQKLGGNAGFVGSVGSDAIGRFLSSWANNAGFSYLNLKQDDLHNTTLAFVELDGAGERSFSFYRKNTADYFIDFKQVEEGIKNASIVHLGSLMLSEKYGEKLADYVVKLTKESGKLLSFDVNYREDIFKDQAHAIKVYKKYLKHANVVKLSEDELYTFAETTVLNDALKKVARKNQLLFVTLGSKGSVAVYNQIVCKQESIKVKVVDTTGAGDAFYAGVLSRLDGLDFSSLTKEQLSNALKFGNVCGALTASGYGAVDACPSEEEVLSKLG